jgi:hypothetical protein
MLETDIFAFTKQAKPGPRTYQRKNYNLQRGHKAGGQAYTGRGAPKKKMRYIKTSSPFVKSGLVPDPEAEAWYYY